MLRDQGGHLGDGIPMLGFEECIGVFQVCEGSTGHSSPSKIDVVVSTPCPRPRPRRLPKEPLSRLF